MLSPTTLINYQQHWLVKLNLMLENKIVLCAIIKNWRWEFDYISQPSYFYFYFYNIKAPPVFSDLYQSTASIATREN